MSKQTINIGASPNDGTGTPLRTSFDYTNQNFTELYTAVGPSGNNIVVPGNATITGALTVDTSTLKVDSTNHRVGIGTATPALPLDVAGGMQVTSGSAGGLYQWAYGASASSRSWRAWNDVSANGDFQISTSTTRTGSTYSDRYRIDVTGVHEWSNTSGLAMTLNSTGLGVGGSPSSRLDVANSGTPVVFSMTLTGAQRWQQIIDTTAGNWTLRDQTGSIDALIVKAGSGNVGIGVTPSAWNSAFKAVEFGSGNALFSGSSGYSQAYFGNNVFYNTSGNYVYKNTQAAGMYIQNQGAHQWYNAPSGTAAANITFTQAMTLDASGNLLVGKTALSSATAGIQLEAVGAVTSTRSAGAAAYFNRLTSDGFLVLIGRESSIVGDISVTTTGTTFNSTSDYRLKEAVQPLVGGLARVSALKPSVYKWKANGSAGEGFLAHELAEVVPAAVTGEKDAVNADGSIKAQSIDMSRVVPILVAAIQELTARLQTLEAR